MMSLSYLLLAEGSNPEPQGGILGNGLMLPVLMFVMLYFLFIRPSQRQRKEQEARVAAMQKGDRVVTSAGIHALVHNIGEKTVTLKVAEGVMLEFDKSAVSTVIKKESAASASESK